jgi:hypothetical protein
MESFPSNSHKKTKPMSPDQKNVTKVVTGEVVQRKKSLGRRFKDIFMGGDIRGVTRYIAADVLLPAVRNMVVDATTEGIRRAVYGESPARRGRSSDPMRSRVSYHSPMERSPMRPTMLPDQPPYSARRKQDPNEIILVSREEAELVVERLADLIDNFDVATVGDFHELVGLPSTYVDNKWGWTAIRGVDIRQVREGYLIELPPIEPI